MPVTIVLVIKAILDEGKFPGTPVSIIIAQGRSRNVIGKHKPDIMIDKSYHRNKSITDPVIQSSDQLLIPISRNIVLGIQSDNSLVSTCLIGVISHGIENYKVTSFKACVEKSNISRRDVAVKPGWVGNKK